MIYKHTLNLIQEIKLFENEAVLHNLTKGFVDTINPLHAIQHAKLFIKSLNKEAPDAAERFLELVKHKHGEHFMGLLKTATDDTDEAVRKAALKSARKISTIQDVGRGAAQGLMIGSAAGVYDKYKDKSNT